MIQNSPFSDLKEYTLYRKSFKPIVETLINSKNPLDVIPLVYMFNISLDGSSYLASSYKNYPVYPYIVLKNLLNYLYRYNHINNPTPSDKKDLKEYSFGAINELNIYL